MTHTPGPWKAITGGADAKVVCPDGRSFLIGDIIYHDENKANANLIAAAPVMLKGLKRAEQTVRNLASELEGDAKQIAENEAANLRDDIAKAEGDNNG